MQNHAVERIWVEVNKRVNYPIKKVLVSMEDEGLISTECQQDPLHCFCVSWFTLHVVREGTELAIAAWNNHAVPGLNFKHAFNIHAGVDAIRIMSLIVISLLLGKGMPNVRMQLNNRLFPLDPHVVPTAVEAVSHFHSAGGKLTLFSHFGVDPLHGRRELCEMRLRTFTSRYKTFASIFHAVCNGDESLFRSALLYFIDITKRMSHSL